MKRLAPLSDVVIIDVLSFTTCVNIAVNRGGIVFPFRNQDASAIEFATRKDAMVIAGCLRNASAVASYVQQKDGIVSIIGCGERWIDGSLRPSFEDIVAAGSILSHLEGYKLSPEARLAVANYHSVQHDLLHLLQECGSGRELIGRGFPEDVFLASQLNSSTIVPILLWNIYLPLRSGMKARTATTIATFSCKKVMLFSLMPVKPYIRLYC